MPQQDVWEVYQRMEVMRNDGPWERSAYDALVWKCDGTKITVTQTAVPDGFVRGMLRVKLNGAAATLSDFLPKLTSLNLTLSDVVKAIRP